MGIRFRELTQTATDADFVEGNYFGVDTPSVTKKVPANLLAKQSGLESINGDVASLQSAVTGLQSAMTDAQSDLSVFGKSSEYNEDALYVCDAAGHVICKIDANGVTSTKFNGNNLALNDVLSTYDDAFYITDPNGNVIFKVDETGVYGLNLNGGGSVATPYKDKVIISIGDSLSASGKWQTWLAEWLGMQFDQEVNHDGKDGHAAMAVGGTAIMPTEGSIYMRALDAHFYNPDIIFIYAGQNDVPYFGNASSVTPSNLGTIDDVPYTKDVPYTELPQSEWSDYTSFYQGMPTFYSRAMGLVEKLQTSCPTARMFILTQMQMWTPDGTQSVSRLALDTAWKDIGAKYSIPVVSLWFESCVNKLNASEYYPAANNVHPNDYGYKRIAETIYTHL